MSQPSAKLLRRRCKRCRKLYCTEVPGVLQGGEFWPSHCPSCGRLEVDFIVAANWVEEGAVQAPDRSAVRTQVWKPA